MLPLLIIVVLLTSSAEVMGEHRNGPLLRWLGWTCAIVMMAASGDSSASTATKSGSVGSCFFVRVSSRVEPKKSNTNHHVEVFPKAKAPGSCPYCCQWN